MNSAEVFKRALNERQAMYGVELNEAAIQRLARYYELLQFWNARLHLVAPIPAHDFAMRHVLESLMLTRFVPMNARVADIGSGGGLPIIPCLVARDDISAVLIESSKKKSVFLLEALKEIDASTRARVISERFESIGAPPIDFVTSRALERFSEVLPNLVNWAPNGAAFFFFGGPDLGNSLRKLNMQTDEILIPNSERRFLFRARKTAELPS